MHRMKRIQVWCVTLVLALLVPGVHAETVEYIHTDALGSPVAITNEAGQVIERTDYEPYGSMIGKANNDRPGYTGHVMDSATGLTYMQQRYYDPTIGRFLSVDPVAANANTGASFNRYDYALNNPYHFIDPDGRQAATCGSGSNPCQGRIPQIERKPMPVVHGIILHRTGGSTAQGAISQWKSPSNTDHIGAHFVIDSDGKTTQTASTSMTTNNVGKIRAREPDAAEAKLGPSAMNKVEQAKAYPDRYPTNNDSIGIEVVGAFNLKTGQFSDPTAAQLQSVGQLVGSLQSQFKLTNDDIYRHGDISYKQPSEGAGLGYDPKP